MSSAASPSPDFSKSPADSPAEAASLKVPPARPTLVSPPKRPSRPTLPEKAKAKPAEAPSTAAAPPAPPPAVQPAPVVDDTASRYQPIAPPSEPMQYRAIGLIRGTYTPDEDDQLNRGSLTTEEGVAIEAVLLGRVTSLVKKHLDLTSPHLWVVYPRTRRAEDDAEDQDLHVQIVGVWEPETLGLPGEGSDDEAGDEAATGAAAAVAPAEANGPEANAPEANGPKAENPETEKPEVTDPLPPAASEKPKISLADLPPVDENYFSIRGEVVQYDEEQQLIGVKILQGLKRPPASRKAFRLVVQGTLEGRTLGYFWELNVKREAKTLVLVQGIPVGIVPPKKRKGGSSGRRSGPPRRGGPGGPGGKRPFPSSRPAAGRPTPNRSAEARSPEGSAPIPKPKIAE